MLRRLSITNYALIEHLNFQPGEGLSIITGETGAGKSVMLGALGLLKGERADMKVIADKAKKVVVEAVFDNIAPEVSQRIQDEDPEWDGEELLIRREIYPSGRSRAFINDSPAPLGRLEEVSRGLLDIHSQNSNSLLSEQTTQLQLLDSVAGNETLLEEYTAEFKKYVTLRQTIRKAKEDAAKNREHAEIIAFRLGQLDKLKPKAGELARIEARYETLSNSEELRGALLKARNALDGGESSGAIERIDEASVALANIDFTLWEENDPLVAERLRQCAVELKDIVETIEDATSFMEYDPASMDKLSARMNDYYSALKTFKLESDAQLEELHATLKKQLRAAEGDDEDTAELEKQAKETAKLLKAQAAQLSKKRHEAAATLQREIETEARKLGLNNLRFEIRLSEAKLTKSGGDTIDFMAAFNKNSEPVAVGAIASGGEMARLMLAVKKITSSRMKLPTIIFDEIDTGVSGSIADSMGEMMKEMGDVMQIITITHLPQVAVKGSRHFKVYKEDRDDKTVSDVMLLSDEEREEEIGRMLSGEEINEAALTNARSLLKKR